MTMHSYDFHPFTEIYPLLEGEDFDALALDIAANGLVLPILLYDGQILDGRNRYRACGEAGVEPHFAPADAEDDDAALELVMSLNQHRRHLTFQEKAFAAARYANLKHGSNQFKREDTSRDVSSREKKISVSEAAEKFDVSTASVDRARRVIKFGDEALEQDVKKGKKHLRIAAEQVSPKKKKQTGARGQPVVRVVDLGARKRAPLTREQVDPEFVGTELEFITEYGHVWLETAQERATSRFTEWSIQIGAFANQLRQYPLRKVDANWLRSPKPNDLRRLREAYKVLKPALDTVEMLLEKTKEIETGE